MSVMGETSVAYKKLVDELLSKAEGGDELAIRCLAALSLLAEGWRYGDPDPTEPPNGGGEPIDLASYRKRLAA